MGIMYAVQLAVLLFLLTSGDAGVPGVTYQLKAVADAWLELPYHNYNYGFLIVSYHPGYPKKRTLIQFNDIPNSCQTVNYANMYIYYTQSFRVNGLSDSVAPFITRTIQAHRVLKSWNETQVTSSKRNNYSKWSKQYLGLDDTDANDCPTGSVNIYAHRPAGYVEIDVTSAAKDWKAGKPNYGLLLWATNEDQAGYDTRFASRSNGASSRVPYILINCN